MIGRAREGREGGALERGGEGRFDGEKKVHDWEGKGEILQRRGEGNDKEGRDRGERN